MQLGFITFGFILVGGVVIHGFELRTIPILIYGACIICSGIYCSSSFIESTAFNAQEANIHSWCAQIAGMSFCLGILLQIFYTSNNQMKTIHFVFFILVILSSASFGYFKNFQGVAQRILYLVSLCWLSFYFEP